MNQAQIDNAIKHAVETGNWMIRCENDGGISPSREAKGFEWKPIGTNYYTGEHRHYAVPFDRVIWGKVNNGMGQVNLGNMVRVTQSDKIIITNTRFTGHAITCFLDKKYLIKCLRIHHDPEDDSYQVFD